MFVTQEPEGSIWKVLVSGRLSLTLNYLTSLQPPQLICQSGHDVKKRVL
jgi:hypothetical protein